MTQKNNNTLRILIDGSLPWDKQEGEDRRLYGIIIISQCVHVRQHVPAPEPEPEPEPEEEEPEEKPEPEEPKPEPKPEPEPEPRPAEVEREQAR